MINKSSYLLLFFCFASAIACEPDIEQLIENFQKNQLTFEHDCAQLRTQAALKLLKSLQRESIQIITNLDNPLIKPRILFKPTTISSAAALRTIETQLLPALDFCDDPQASAEESRVLKKLARTFSELYEHLTQLYKDTVKAALEQVDDPKTLEQLLELS